MNSAAVSPTPEGDRSSAESPEPRISASPSSSAEPSADPSVDPSAGPSVDPSFDSSASGAEDRVGSGSGGGPEPGAGTGDEQAGTARSDNVCSPDDVVVTLSADKTDYAWDVRPEFTLSVVNTGPRTCTMKVSGKILELRVTSGDDRIWSTADCAENAGAEQEQLRRGVPYTTVITWDRKRSWTDCRDQEVTARSGTYVVKLHSDYDEGAEAQVFRLN